MEKALIIKTSGEFSVAEFEAGQSYDLLRNAVDGYIECVSINPALDMWLNEEGKLIGLPVNPFATRMFQNRYGQVDVMVGDVVLTGGVDEDGVTLGLDADLLESLLMVLNSRNQA